MSRYEKLGTEQVLLLVYNTDRRSNTHISPLSLIHYSQSVFDSNNDYCNKQKTEKLSKVLQYEIKMKLRVHKSIHYKNCQSKYFQIWGLQGTEKDH
jgi:hypothetical protein